MVCASDIIRKTTVTELKRGGIHMIVRPDYIHAITPFIDQPLVKILAGVRRCGKSTIFEMLTEELRSRGIPDDHIIQKRYTEIDIPEDISAADMYQELMRSAFSCLKIRTGKLAT